MSKSVRQVSRRSQVIRAQWQSHLDTQRSSGLSQATYCREHHLNEKYFSLWKRKLRAVPDLSQLLSVDQSEVAVPTFIAAKC